MVVLADQDGRTPCAPAVLGTVEDHPVREADEIRGARGSEPDLRISAAFGHLQRDDDVVPRRSPVEGDVRLVGRPAVGPRHHDGAAEEVFRILGVGGDHRLAVGDVAVAGDEDVRADHDARAGGRGRLGESRRRRERRAEEEGEQSRRGHGAAPYGLGAVTRTVAV